MCGRIGERMTRTELFVFGSPRVMQWTIRLIVVSVPVVLVSCVVLAMIRSAALASFIPFLVPLGASLGFMFLLLFLARRARGLRVAGIMLEFQRCPQCGYDLRMLPADAQDGATVCPECGCAWHVSHENVVMSEREERHREGKA